ncbi:hypothetical protein [Aequorivita lipolytica]|uniref:Gliding motility-associated protein GldM C-terminal domain-containing protein n=1 Tax=Aequorivita lipolytica TaxID=153267 RepID=A0A5C6YNT0_9FLAO|nr:hypothetical protein [Aequorivita lipolytica]TXD68949.1 hypothetical protein ESV24_09340 [Aequorivita lipolytica]SRX53079.1 hypothetical protein AEQU2_02307 [Aequorivita lipolytica]
MKTLNKVLFIVACLLLTITANAQEENDEQKRDRVEKSTKPFNPSYFSLSENSFYVLEAMVVDNKIVIDSSATIALVPGKMPYPSGNFKVSIMDKQGKQISEYFMQDPLIARSCEGENNNLTPLEKGRVYISLPKNNNIGTLIFSRGKERVGTVDVGDLIIRTQRDPNKGGQ